MSHLAPSAPAHKQAATSNAVPPASSKTLVQEMEDRKATALASDLGRRLSALESATQGIASMVVKLSEQLGLQSSKASDATALLQCLSQGLQNLTDLVSQQVN